MLGAVVGKYGYRPFGGQPLAKQPGRHRPDPGQGLGIRQLDPGPVGAALDQKRPRWRRRRPVFKAGAEFVGTGQQRHRRAQDLATVRALLDAERGRRKELRRIA